MNIEWHEYTSAEPYVSDHWAASDRGWARWTDHPDSSDYDCSAIGNYLSYAPFNSRGPQGQTIHTCAYLYGIDPISNQLTHRSLGASWHHTIATAKAWIETTVRDAAWQSGGVA
jgi:hypothetical protein